jgi:hypothetical protein
MVVGMPLPAMLLLDVPVGHVHMLDGRVVVLVAVR